MCDYDKTVKKDKIQRNYSQMNSSSLDVILTITWIKLYILGIN